MKWKITTISTAQHQDRAILCFKHNASRPCCCTALWTSGVGLWMNNSRRLKIRHWHTIRHLLTAFFFHAILLVTFPARISVQHGFITLPLAKRFIDSAIGIMRGLFRLWAFQMCAVFFVIRSTTLFIQTAFWILAFFLCPGFGI